MSEKPVVLPQKPWKSSPKQRMVSALVLLGAMLTSYLLVATTPMEGKLAYFLVFFFAFTLFDFIFHYLTRGIALAKDAIARAVVALGISLAVAPIISILATVVMRGYKGIHLSLFTTDMKLNSVSDPIDQGGLLHAITGTAILVIVALLISVPLGILTAVYMTEIKGRFIRPIKFLVQAMSGVPSIVAGLFILSAIVYPITKSYSGFVGALALSILMIPTVARTSEEVLLLIPNDLREAGVALGGTQWRTVAMVVVPAARSGLVTAMILGIARIAGETAPVLLLTGGGDTVNGNPFSGPMGSLPFYIWKSYAVGTEESVTRAWAGILVLLVIVLVLFVSARILSERRTKS
ncbi:MAG TPA: phosphate ABC transporter permease PstA [Candidatus Paceibacterota bacterium]|nr:phosphate ABC transporter permease PstA [Candidatus Paceibacterota bacterium]